MTGEASPPPISTPKWLDLPPAPQTLTGNDIHLWLIPLDQHPDILQRCATILSPHKSARAERFRLPHLRTRYTVAHAALRQILAAHLDAAPQALTFTHSPHGKPSLSPHLNPTHLTFNLSHSADLALLAITRTNRLGVDLERREPKPDLPEIAARSFTPRESAAILSLPEAQRTPAFYACWTLKEAYLKATGEGLATPMNTFDVTFPPLAPPAILLSNPPWQASSLTLGDHTASLVAEGLHHSIYRAEWHPDTGSFA